MKINKLFLLVIILVLLFLGLSYYGFLGDIKQKFDNRFGCFWSCEKVIQVEEAPKDKAK